MAASPDTASQCVELCLRLLAYGFALTIFAASIAMLRTRPRVGGMAVDWVRARIPDERRCRRAVHLDVDRNSVDRATGEGAAGSLS